MPDFDFWASNVRQVYPKSPDLIACESFLLNPVVKFEFEPSQFLQLLQHLYGLCKSRDLWHATSDMPHRLDLKMTPFSQSRYIRCNG